eukprot:6485992-Amphidinium_carterae.1
MLLEDVTTNVCVVCSPGVGCGYNAETGCCLTGVEKTRDLQTSSPQGYCRLLIGRVPKEVHTSSSDVLHICPLQE